ncbi:hypothetical protein KSZ_50840 [Dictyobacter formicarum]|uniref:Uncharacterized protein n=1 Tax=Dictyobacter formicarum TaxID=2778368 RepID=A0ABQ3VNX4_9CHLR|nr:hypothetical protein KSZ_50840 [Dictyobacter formicarum]
MLQIGCNWFDCLDYMDKHGKIGRNQFSPGWPVLVCGIENVCDLGKAAQFLVTVVSIKQIKKNTAKIFSP